MATICFRPPPLPPNKKQSSQLNLGRYRKQQQNSTNNNNNGLLSSTYLSFRDPAEDEIAAEEIEMTNLKQWKKMGSKRYKKVVHTNSLSRKNGDFKSTMIRSQSDGNLSKKVDDAPFAPMTINRYIKVLSGSWKNLLNLGGMSRPPKPAATAKKVAPPAVPHEFRHSGSSFGSAGYASSEDAGGFLAPSSEAPGVPRDDHSDYGSTVSSSTGKSPGPIFQGPAFTFPGQPPPGGVLTHKAAVYYHHQLSLQEDQGIDMTQSPGRDSPGSSSGSAGSGSRHSTASLDSGRASYLPLSTTGRSTIGSSNSPRCSLSSCSIGSEQGRIERMIHQGIPDQEIIHAWLVDLQYDEYFPLFVGAGYDLPTIGRMTPEDLTAIGIKKPNHRKRIKAEIAQLNLPDNLPEFIPGSLEEWLQLLRLEEYLPAFLDQGYQTVDAVTQLTWEDLEEFGIVKLGHQKKIMLAIKRVKDIQAGKRISTDSNRIYTTQDVMVHAPPLQPPPTLGPLLQQQQQQQPPPSPSGLCPAVHSTFRSFHQPWEIDQTRQLIMSSSLTSSSTGGSGGTATTTPTHYVQQQFFCTDIVPIKIRTGRGKSLESLEDPTERTHHTFSSENTQVFYYHHHPHHPHPHSHHPPPIGWRTRSYDDGDITPTNESALLYEGGGTLPRPRGVIRPRPIAKIQAKARETTFPDFEKPQFNPEKYASPQYNKTLPRVDLIHDPNKYHIQYSPMMGKKIPPNPPKRQDSEGGNEQTTTVEIHHVQTSSPLPLPAYPSSDSLSIISLDNQGDLSLPPPPAPGTPPGSSMAQQQQQQMAQQCCKMNSSQSWGAEEQELIKTLALQHRNGSDASFKSSSSTESDSLPFANENAGTIRTRAGGCGGGGGSGNGGATSNRPSTGTAGDYSSPAKPRCSQSLPPHPSPTPSSNSNNSNNSNSQNSRQVSQQQQQQQQSSARNTNNQRSEPADVLNDIGNMLANLTDELDAMLEEEKRQQ